MEKNKEYTVLVTGFGPFGNHVINASWEAVKELINLFANSKEMKDITVIAKEIPVSYEYVAMYISQLWEEYKPTVVIHVGVSHKAQCLTIEHCARNNGYLRPDIYGNCPEESDVESKIFNTEIDIGKICSMINANTDKTECTVCISHDAGRYLCEYTYFKSLQISQEKTLFVHVPDFNRYSSAETARGLYDILYYVIRDMENSS